MQRSSMMTDYNTDLLRFPDAQPCIPRFATPRTPERKTLGGAAAKIAIELGMPLMDWQRRVLDVALELENGQFVYKEVIVTVPRQSGKTTMMLSLILARCLGLDNQRVVYTAQTRSDARKKWFEEWIPVLDVSPFAEHFKQRLANGDESLLFDNGSRQGLVASTAKAGHGQTLDLGIIDEAFAQPDARLEQALKPAMVTRNILPHRGSQLWIISTAGTLTASPFLLQKVEAGREISASGHNRQVAYFEWSAPEDADPGDEAVWRGCMPALGRTASVDAIRADFLSMDLHEFQRAYLNVWTTISVDPAFPIAVWDERKRDYNSEGIVVSLGVDVAFDRSAGAIGAAGYLPGGEEVFVEVLKHERGVKWIVPALKTLIEKHDVSAVVVAKDSPAAALLETIKQEVWINLYETNAAENGKAFNMFVDAVVDRQSVVHPGQPAVRAAIDGGVRRPVGDAGWTWGRKDSGVDISPVSALTLAHWHAVTFGTESVGVYDLNTIVENVRKKRADEAIARGEMPPAVRSFGPGSYNLPDPRQHPDAEDRGGGVTFIPI